MELMIHRLAEHGQVYKHGAAARLANLSRACTVSGGLLLAGRGRSSQAAAAAAGALLSIGAVAMRWSVFKAGFQSAADPAYVIGPQRAAVELGQRRGAARARPRVAQPDPTLGSPAVTIGHAGSAVRSQEG
jgi:hypothetical protein